MDDDDLRMPQEPKEIPREHLEPPEEFNVQLVQYDEPIIIKDESKTEEENNEMKRDKYPAELDVLFSHIFPPREWEEDGKTWCQVVSTKPVTLAELKHLNIELDRLMMYWRGNSLGLCPVRRELYSQFFDELIRQVYVINGDRGEVLIRIRNEFLATLEAYRHNYECANVFNDRKTVNSHATNDKTKYIKMMNEKNDLLVEQLNNARNNFEYETQNLKNELSVLKKKNVKELKFFTMNHEALEAQFKMLNVLKK